MLAAWSTAPRWSYASRNTVELSKSHFLVAVAVAAALAHCHPSAHTTLLPLPSALSYRHQPCAAAAPTCGNKRDFICTVYAPVMMVVSFLQLLLLLAATAQHAASAADAALPRPLPLPWSAAHTSTRAPAADEAVCTLAITGDGEGGVRSASLVCQHADRGSLALAAGQLLQPHMPRFRGVRWHPDECGRLDCLITVCGASRLLLLNATISGVAAPDSEGGLCVSGRARVRALGGAFTDNSARNGSLHVRGDASLLLAYATVSRNAGTRGGGAQVSGRGALTSVNSTWSNNKADYGGSVNVRDDGMLFASDKSSFLDNACSSEEDSPAGAAVYCRDGGSVTLTRGVILARNTVTGHDGAGGALYAQDNCALRLSDGVALFDNLVDGGNAAGGGLAAADDVTVVLMRRIELRGNEARGDNSGGGGLFLRDRTTLALTGPAAIIGNVASGDVAQGGGLYASNNASVDIVGPASFVRNAARGMHSTGGGINIRQNSPVSIASRVTFLRNYAMNGGGIALVGDMRAQLSGLNMTQHDIGGRGGAILMDGAVKANLTDMYIVGNRCGNCNDACV